MHSCFISTDLEYYHINIMFFMTEPCIKVQHFIEIGKLKDSGLHLLKASLSHERTWASCIASRGYLCMGMKGRTWTSSVVKPERCDATLCLLCRRG